jgi:ketosteroid isomerase-like protein
VPVEAKSAVRLSERLYELFNRRDLDGMVALAAPDVEWDWSRSIGPDAGLRHGPAAVRRFVAEQWEHWQSIEMTPEELVEAGDEVVAFVRVRLTGRDGIEVEARGPHVLSWREGQLVRYRLFQEREEALAAVGLR